ncbi:MAG: LysM peptidoglycan-binding domain-containing protein [Raineya sp.]|nr:LysM peptidoglycan-binding domain-containing protein [Raineya sp.]
MKLTSLFFLFAFGLIHVLLAIPTDSLRLEIDKNKKRAWIIHKVEPKETLFGLARRYKTTAEEIIKENPQAKNLRIGDILRIPYKDFENQAILTAPKEKDKSKVSKHIVEAKETLYSIARKYNVSVKDLQTWNKLENNDIKLGQELWVTAPPDDNKDLKEIKTQEVTEKTQKVEVKDKNEKVEQKEIKTTEVHIHTVKEDESPYSIAKKYKVKLTELLEWNNLDQNSRLQIGQKLEIYPSGYKKEKPEAKVETNSEKNISQEVRENSENKTAIEANEADIPEITRQTITISGYSKVIERGMAVVMEDEKAGNYTGLHREAPIGTIVAVKNENNGESVFVRIVGKLPSAGNSKVLIKVSKNVFEALGAKKNAIPVEVSYIP